MTAAMKLGGVCGYGQYDLTGCSDRKGWVYLKEDDTAICTVELVEKRGKVQEEPGEQNIECQTIWHSFICHNSTFEEHLLTSCIP